MRTTLTLTIASILTAIFSMWFFPLNGFIMYGLVLGTGFVVVASLFAVITHLLYKENF